MKKTIVIVFALLMACNEKTAVPFDVDTADQYLVLWCEDETDERREGLGKTLRFNRAFGPTGMHYFSNEGHWAGACNTSECSGFTSERYFEFSVVGPAGAIVTHLNRTTGRWNETVFYEDNILPPNVVAEGDCHEVEPPAESQVKF